MKRVVQIIALLGVAWLAVGCAASARPDAPARMLARYKTSVIPPLGLIYAHVHAPVTAGPASLGPKTGRATVWEIGLPPLPFAGLATGASLFSWGDASEETAMKNGGIREIHQVDYELESYLMVYRTFTLEVTGR